MRAAALYWQSLPAPVFCRSITTGPDSRCRPGLSAPCAAPDGAVQGESLKSARAQGWALSPMR